MRIRFDDPTPDSYDAVLRNLEGWTVKLSYKNAVEGLYPTEPVVIARNDEAGRSVVDADGDLYVKLTLDDGTPEAGLGLYIPLDDIRSITIL